MFAGTVKILRRMFPKLRWDIEGDPRVFLTFDDGPTPGVTEWILAELAKYDAKATFFCLGKNAEQYPDLYERIVAGGHKIGNHTYSHQKGWSMSLRRYVEDIDFANQILHSDLFRPPYGRIKPRQLRVIAERYTVILWSVLSRDYSRVISPRKCLENVIKNIRPGSIVVFHDSAKAFRNLRYALPRTLEYMQKNNLQCAPIEP